MITKTLIHLLGGVTQKEKENHGQKMYDMGMYTAYQNVQHEMERINGVDADQWCRHMYQSVKMLIDKVK